VLSLLPRCPVNLAEILPRLRSEGAHCSSSATAPLVRAFKNDLVFPTLSSFFGSILGQWSNDIHRLVRLRFPRRGSGWAVITENMKWTRNLIATMHGGIGRCVEAQERLRLGCYLGQVSEALAEVGLLLVWWNR
jgi:hypothetical protein